MVNYGNGTVIIEWNAHTNTITRAHAYIIIYNILSLYIIFYIIIYKIIYKGVNNEIDFNYRAWPLRPAHGP